MESKITTESRLCHMSLGDVSDRGFLGVGWVNPAPKIKCLA